MTPHEVAREIVRQEGWCEGTKCDDCPLLTVSCPGIPSSKHLSKAIEWLSANPEPNEARMPKYQIEPISNYAPWWFQRGMRCKVWSSDPCLSYKTWVADYQDGYFITITNGGYGCTRWPHAEPVEAWEPQEGEWVAEWFGADNHFRVVRYSAQHAHHARLQYPDGRVIDCACDVETLKTRTNWV